LDSPVYITSDGTGNGRLYIVERAGRVLVMLPNGRIRSRPLLDLRGTVATDGERGLHAIAFHPRFKRNGLFYVHYNTADGDTNIVEYRMRDPDAEVSAGSGRRIMRFGRPDWNHNGGWIGFGPDRMLYIAMGDGGGDSPGDTYGFARQKGALLAKILRIDVDEGRRYGIPRDNPYARGQRGFAPETFAWGLRNPWRASFDRLTGDLWIGDVGQDEVEEIDLSRAGKSGLDFGWSEMEGSRCHGGSCDRDAYVLPVTEYTHADGCSVTGGYVYRGTRSPLLYGGYLFADYCSGKLYGIDARGARPGDDLRARVLDRSGHLWVSFGEDDEGELYIVDIGAREGTGAIFHIVARPRR
jgi:glucose/arabinose dehydrogenase